MTILILYKDTKHEIDKLFLHHLQRSHNLLQGIQTYISAKVAIAQMQFLIRKKKHHSTMLLIFH